MSRVWTCSSELFILGRVFWSLVAVLIGSGSTLSCSLLSTYQLEESSCHGSLQNGVCAVRGRGRNNSNKGQQGSTYVGRIKQPCWNLECSEEMRLLVIWIKAFQASLCHLHNMWLQPVPWGLCLKDKQCVPHTLLQGEKCPSDSPREWARSDGWQEKGLGHENTYHCILFPKHIQGEGKTEQVTENTENIFVIAFFRKMYPREETLVRIKNRRT